MHLSCTSLAPGIEARLKRPTTFFLRGPRAQCSDQGVQGMPLAVLSLPIPYMGSGKRCFKEFFIRIQARVPND